MKRLLIALPIAALVVTALFLAMREFVPLGRPQADYTIQISQQSVAASLPEEELHTYIFDRPDPLPPEPTLTEPEPLERQPMPREKFSPPKFDEPESLMESRNFAEHCERRRTGPVVFLDGARDGDRVTVEFTIMSDGRVTDVRVIQSSNPAINDAVVEMVGRWHWAQPDSCEGQLAVKQEPRTVRTEIEFRKPEDE